MKSFAWPLVCLAAFAMVAQAEEKPDLAKLARAGDVAGLSAALEAGEPIDAANRYSETALMNAADAGKMETLNLLIERKAGLDVTNKDGRTALFFATFMNHEEAALRLIDAGASCNLADRQGGTPLISAAMQGEEKAVAALLAHAADINAKSRFGSALTVAVERRRAGVIKLLLAKGCQPDVQNELGVTALSYAADQADMGLVQRLVQLGANPNVVDKNGRTPLLVARNNPALATFLLNHGGNVDAKGPDGETLLTYNGEIGNQAFVQLLIQRGAKRREVHLNASPYPFKPLPLEYRWALAAAALRTQGSRQSLEMLGGVPLSQRDGIRRSLIQSWNIHNREEALKTLDWLYTEGHRKGYAELAQAFPSRHEGWVQWQLMALCHTTNPQNPTVVKMLRQIRVLGANPKRNAADDLLGWDYCRYISVAGWCYVAGYLQEDEAWAKIMPVAETLQTTYHSWKEIGESYLLGRDIWGGSEQPQLRAVFDLLSDPKEARSPWNTIPFNTKLGSAPAGAAMKPAALPGW